jgi:hypothetical protein
VLLTPRQVPRGWISMNPPDTGKAPDDLLVTRAELAKVMRVAPGAIDQMIADGMPFKTVFMKRRRFNINAALAWMQNRQKDRQAKPDSR